MSDFTSIPVTRYDHGRVQSGDGSVAEEFTLAMYVNDVPFYKFLCTPRDLNCLVVGYLLTEGVIASAEEIKMLSVNEARSSAAVWLRDKPRHGVAAEGRPQRKPPDMQAILDRMMEFSSHLEMSAQAGGVHGAALCTQREMLLYHEDIGRYNAMDKLIGDAALQDVETAGMMLLTSGRVSSEMVQRSAVAQAAVLVSSAAPTVQAVRMAREYGIALIGMAEGRKCNVYCS